MRWHLTLLLGVGLLFVGSLLAVLFSATGAGAAVEPPSTPIARSLADDPARVAAAVTPQAGRRTFLPLAMRAPRPTPTPTPAPTATPSRTLLPTCRWFPLGPSDSDDVECSATNGLVITRGNISHTMVACCGTNGARHYAISVDAARVAGEGDYRIGFDVRSLTQGGGYLFGVNPDTRTYSLHRVDDANWKGGIVLIPWTFSDHILPGAAFNRLEVERYGAAILLRINGQQVAAVNETTWLDQGIGWALYARNYQAGGAVMQFENMRYLQWNDIAAR